MPLVRWLLIAIALVAVATPVAVGQYSRPVDARAYNLGIIGGFSEVVRLGVKTLALSEVMTAAEMDDILPDARVVAERNGVELFREPDLLVTDLYPADVAVGREVLLIYTGDTLDRYQALKTERRRLVDAGGYDDEAREGLARRFGELLSYPDEVIDELIAATRAAQENTQEK